MKMEMQISDVWYQLSWSTKWRGPDYFCFNSDSDAQSKNDHVIEYVAESESDGLVNQGDNVDVEQTSVDQESVDVQQTVKRWQWKWRKWKWKGYLKWDSPTTTDP